MAVPMDPTSAAFLFAENRQMPMHVGGLQLFEKPEGAPRDYVRQIYEQMSEVDEIAPLFLKRPTRGITTRRPVGLDAGRQLRPRVPLPAQRPAQAGPRPRAARPLLAAAQHPAGPRAAAVGGAPDRGHARRPGGALHEDAPLAGRRHLRDAAAAERDDHRPRQARHARDVGGPAQREDREGPGRGRAQPGRRTPRRDAYGARHHRRRRRTARRPGQDPQARSEERDLGALALRPAHDVQHHDHRLTPLRRPGLADRAAARDRQGERHHPERRGAGDVLGRDPHLPDRARRAARLRARLDGAGGPERQAVAVGLRRRRQRRRRGDGQARHRAARPGRPARRDPRAR